MIINSVEDFFMAQRQTDLIRAANITANRVQRGGYLFDVGLNEVFWQTMYDRSVEETVRIIVLDRRGVVLSDTTNEMVGFTLVNSEVISALREETASVIQPDGRTRHTAVPVYDQNAVVSGVVLVVSTVQDINELIEVLTNSSTMLNFIMATVAALAALFAAQIIINPLKRVLKAVERMAQGHLNERINITGADEFSQLCLAFNDMNDKIEKVEKNRSEFVSNVSHELKTPLSSIKVLSDSLLMQESVPEEMYREFLQDINSEINRMDHIINDLLTLVKLDQQAAGLNLEMINVNKLINDIVKRLKPLADVKEITIYKEELKEDVNIKADEMKLTLAISNLVENAIKYTEEGGDVKVIIDAGHQHVFLTVSDSGIGLAEEEFAKIFTRFYRVDKTRDRDTGGTGLGLAITHSAILSHGGSIMVSSKEGAGSSFIVRLPIKPQEKLGE